MRQAARDWLLSVIAVVCVLSMFGFGWLYAINRLIPVVEIVGVNYLVPKEVRAGDTVDICRGMRMNMDAHIVISRALTQTGPDGAERAISFGRMEVTHKAGTLNQCRSLQLPDHIVPGEWLLRTYIHAAPAWPLWPQEFEFGQPMPITIIQQSDAGV